MSANISCSQGGGETTLGVGLFMCNKLFTVRGALYLSLDNV
jgi:hypothetical protein